MWSKSFVGRIIILGVTLVAGLTVGMLGCGPETNTFPNQNQATAPVYPMNENGQTYGSIADTTSLETEPDLIQAQGVDGTIGYVRSVDLHGIMPKTPEEALDQQRKAPSIRRIPLYAVDGKTVVGTFNVEKGDGKIILSDD